MCIYECSKYLRMYIPFSDEELGGELGMVPFCESERFKKMNVGFSLDEGLANPTEAVSVYYGERSPYCESLDTLICSPM